MAYDINAFRKNRTLGNAGFMFWSAAAVAIPIVPGSYAGRAVVSTAKVAVKSGGKGAVKAGAKDAVKIVSHHEPPVYVSTGNRKIPAPRILIPTTLHKPITKDFRDLIPYNSDLSKELKYLFNNDKEAWGKLYRPLADQVYSKNSIKGFPKEFK